MRHERLICRARRAGCVAEAGLRRVRLPVRAGRWDRVHAEQHPRPVVALGCFSTDAAEYWRLRTGYASLTGALCASARQMLCWSG